MGRGVAQRHDHLCQRLSGKVPGPKLFMVQPFRTTMNRRFGPVVRTGRGEPMSQQDALLAAVRADPDDDTACLAYADWLEETGGADESRRAEFIRVQSERARLPPDDPRQSGLEA